MKWNTESEDPLVGPLLYQLVMITLLLLLRFLIRVVRGSCSSLGSVIARAEALMRRASRREVTLELLRVRAGVARPCILLTLSVDRRRRRRLVLRRRRRGSPRWVPVFRFDGTSSVTRSWSSMTIVEVVIVVLDISHGCWRLHVRLMPVMDFSIRRI